MRLNIDRIPPEGAEIEENITAGDLELDVQEMSLKEPLRAKARVSRITNAVHVDLELKGSLYLTCTRCLNEFRQSLDKRMKLDYVVDAGQHELDLDPDIREELILGFQIKNLCKPDCKGLCIKCGTNLNEGKCTCRLGMTSRKE